MLVASDSAHSGFAVHVSQFRQRIEGAGNVPRSERVLLNLGEGPVRFR